MRIQNAEALLARGNLAGRRAALDILEAGLRAADPYHATRRLLRVESGRLIVGHLDFEPSGSPRTGPEVFDLDRIGRIYVVGAAKGIQPIAKAIEEILGDRLSGGHVIAKHGDDHILERIGVTYGGHPIPDEGCVEGCRRILDLCRDLRPEDLVFTIAGNGISSLLTLPAPGISLEDVRRLTYLMQIERGAPTVDLNPIRNNVDLMKGGRISRHIQPATAVHILAYDPDGQIGVPVRGYAQFMHGSRFLHTLPSYTSYDDAIAMLRKWDAWDDVAPSIREHLLHADPALATVKADEFERTRFRIFGVMPNRLGMIPAAARRAAELGFTPHVLARRLQAEASQAARTLMCVARTIESEDAPFQTPCALITGGELLVTVGDETGVGGRNQEYALAAAGEIAGSPRIVVAAVDSDGTDGPGGQFTPEGESIPCLAGGIVDGSTAAAAREAGVELREALRRHDTSSALWRVGGGILIDHNISLGDLGVTLVLGPTENAAGSP